MPLEFDLINEVRVPLGRGRFVVVGDKRLVQCLRLAEIEFSHPGFIDKSLQQLAKDCPIGKQFFISTVMDVVDRH